MQYFWASAELGDQCKRSSLFSWRLQSFYSSSGVAAMWSGWADSINPCLGTVRATVRRHSPSPPWWDLGTSSRILSKAAVTWWWGRLLHSSKYDWGRSIWFSSHFEIQKKARMRKKLTGKGELHPRKTACQEVKWCVSKNYNELMAENNHVMYGD